MALEDIDVYPKSYNIYEDAAGNYYFVAADFHKNTLRACFSHWTPYHVKMFEREEGRFLSLKFPSRRTPMQAQKDLDAWAEGKTLQMHHLSWDKVWEKTYEDKTVLREIVRLQNNFWDDQHRTQGEAVGTGMLIVLMALTVVLAIWFSGS